MKKLIYLVLAFVFVSMTINPVTAFSQNNQSEQIDSYSIEANVGPNNSLEVFEVIAYNFGENERHGIYRFIPTIYTGRNGNPRQTLEIKEIKDKNNQNIPYKIEDQNSVKNIIIGDEDVLITGTQTYKIRYSLNNVISSDEDGDRLIWDALGTGWQVPINNLIINLKFDDPIKNKIILNRCFMGTFGSNQLCDYLENNNNIYPAESVQAGNGVTLEVLFEKNTFSAPGGLEMFLWETNWHYWLPVIAFLAFFLFWFEKGRDPKGRGTIVPIYDPPKDISPIEASIILEDSIDKKALPAAIIDLAIKGHIKIHRKDIKTLFVSKPEYELEMIKPLSKSASLIEKKTMDLFFIGRTKVSLNDLGESFPALNHSLHSKAYDSVTKKGYFVVNPNISRIIFFSISVALFVIGMLSATFFLKDLLGYISFGLPGVIGFVFSFIMPVKTKEGAILKEQLLGLKMYIKTAEIDRIKFHNAPEKTTEKFEELLPYAIIFNLEKEWVNEFKDIYKEPPKWMEGNISTFSVAYLISDLSGFSEATSHAITSNASSSGGFGGVGGGSGGGGGGSW